jgi:rSAM/selenodomain-associated transferase 2
MAELKVSVVITTLNEEKHIGNLIENLLAIPEIEIIVSDGGSTDRTPEICRSYPVKFILGEAGRGKQLNRGAKAGEGDVFFFLHADSVINGEIFREMRQAVRKGRGWGCCTMIFDHRALIYRWLAFTAWVRAKFFSSCYGDQGIFCQRDLFFQSGGFPETPIMEDLIFSGKLRRREKAVVLRARIITSTRRFQSQGIYFTIYKMQRAKLMYYLGKPLEEVTAFYRGKSAC